jgi:hypothetical protein
MEVSGKFHGAVSLPIRHKFPGIHFIGAWVVSIADLEVTEERKPLPLPEIEP